MDIDEERLRTSERVAHRMAAAVDARPSITATTDRRAAVDGADHVITMFQIGGYRPSTLIDFEIPAPHGLPQTIPDTPRIGGGIPPPPPPPLPPPAPRPGARR